MTTIYKNCEIIYRRTNKLPKDQVTATIQQQDLDSKDDSNDNYEIVAAGILNKRKDLLEKYDQAKEEGKRLFKGVFNWLSNTGRRTPYYEKCLVVLFDRCFVGSSPQVLCERYPDGLDQAGKPDIASFNSWRKDGRKLITEYLSENKINITENLSDFIRNKHIVAKRATKASRIETSQTEVVNEIADKVNDLISRVLKDFQAEELFSQNDFQEISDRVRYTPLRNPSMNSLINFAFVVTKNEVVSERESQVRGEILSDKYKKEIDAELKQSHDLRNAKEEFINIWAKNALEPKLVSKLGILYFTIFEKLTDEELQTRFPGTSRAVRDQWRRRARVFLADKISPNLKQFLDYCTHRKSSNTSPSIH